MIRGRKKGREIWSEPVDLRRLGGNQTIGAQPGVGRLRVEDNHRSIGPLCPNISDKNILNIHFLYKSIKTYANFLRLCNRIELTLNL